MTEAARVSIYKRTCVFLQLLRSPGCKCILSFGIIASFFLFPAPLESETKHTIQKGDTIYQLGKKYGVPSKDILKANPHVKPTQLKIGDTLMIPDKKVEEKESAQKETDSAASNSTSNKPPPNSSSANSQEQKPDTSSKSQPADSESSKDTTEEKIHLVIQGDTLSRISKLYGISVEKIKEINGLKSDFIRVGQKLKVNSPPPLLDPKGTGTNQSSNSQSQSDSKNKEKTEAEDAQNQQRKEGENKEKANSKNQSTDSSKQQDTKPDGTDKMENKDSDKSNSASNSKESKSPDSKETKSNSESDKSDIKNKEEDSSKKSQNDPPSKKTSTHSEEDEETSSQIDSKNRKNKNNRNNLIFVSKVLDQLESPRRFRKWKYVIVHNSGTASGNAKIFHYYHLNVRGMENGLAYHFVIGNGSDSGDGEIEVSARWLKQIQGGHVASSEMNEIAIGICLVGDFNKTRPTRRQIASLVELTNYLNQRFGRPRFKVHREINIKPTDCPGKYFPVDAMHRLFG